MRRLFLLFNLLTFHFLFSGLLPEATAQAIYFPPKTGSTWLITPSAELGFCPDRIDSLYGFLDAHHTKAFLLLKDGRIVLEKYFGTFVQDSLWYWASAGKSLTGFLIGQAQEENLLAIDDPTSDYLGAGWTNAPPDKEALITLRHQLSMTTGLDDAIAPTPAEPDPDNCTDPDCLLYKADAGTRWAYHNAPYRLLHQVIEAASGLNINLFTKTHVLDRTGMKGLWVDHVMYSRARDVARFGLLVQAHGIWNGDTLLHDAAYFHDMTHPSQDLNKSYGYLWWLNGQPSFMVPSLPFVFPGKLFPHAPDDLIAALGKNDQKIHVVPSKGWVVVRLGESGGFTGIGGNDVPIAFDDALWEYLNALTCLPTVTTEIQENAVKVWPNPAATGWWIESGKPLTRVEIYDAQGRLLRTEEVKKDKPLWLDAAGLPAGMSMARVQDREGSIRWIRLIH